MKDLILFMVVFLIIYLFYFLFVICRKKKLEKIRKSNEIVLLEKKFKINPESFNIKFLAHMIALINAFIIATTFTVAMLFKNNIIKIMIAFVMFMVLIPLIYGLFGKYLKKKEGK